MDKEEIKDYLRDNLTIYIEKTRKYDEQVLKVELRLEDEQIDFDYMPINELIVS